MKFSKIVGFIVVVCMLATMLPAVVFAADTPTVSVASTTCCAGNTVEVPVVLKNNTGIVSMLLKIGYDKEYLTLTGVEDGGILGESLHSDNYEADPYTLSWANDTSDDICTDDGIIATLIFDVREDAPEGICDITIEKIECLDFDGNIVDFAADDGKVEVYQYIIGDVNGDGVVDPKDRMYLSRHLADWIGYDEIDERAANVNGDGILNTQDRMYLSRHLAGWLGYKNLIYRPTGGGGSFGGDITPSAPHYTVNFNTDGGSAIASQFVEEGKTATRPADPTKSGYEFTGWYTSVACTKEYDFSKAVTSDITLWAGWNTNVVTMDKAKQQEAVSKINHFNSELTRILTNYKREFNTYEKEILDIVGNVMKAVLVDATNDIAIYTEDYIGINYEFELDEARSIYKHNLTSTQQTDFQSKIYTYFDEESADCIMQLLFGVSIDDI